MRIFRIDYVGSLSNLHYIHSFGKSWKSMSKTHSLSFPNRRSKSSKGYINSVCWSRSFNHSRLEGIY